MARINEYPNILAFLDMLAWAEGTSTHPHTKDDGYDVIVNGDDGDPRPNIMTSYARHPNMLVKVNTNLKSTAADLFIGGAIAPPFFTACRFWSCRCGYISSASMVSE